MYSLYENCNFEFDAILSQLKCKEKILHVLHDLSTIFDVLYKLVKEYPSTRNYTHDEDKS